MDIHDSPVTCCMYFADCPPDLIPAYYSVGSKSKPKSGYSEKVDDIHHRHSHCSKLPQAKHGIKSVPSVFRIFNSALLKFELHWSYLITAVYYKAMEH